MVNVRAVAIQDAGLACALGSSFPAAGLAYAMGQRRFRRYKSVIGVDGLPMTLGCVIPYDKLRDFPERLRRLCDMALDDLTSRLPLPPHTLVRVMIQAWMRHSPIYQEIAAGISDACRRRDARAEFHFGGAADALSLIGNTAYAIARGKADVVLVGALDSFLQPELLDRMTMQGRIPSKQNPYGGVPAEGACILRLAPADATREATPPGEILAYFRGHEEEDVMRPKGLLGRGLAAAYRHAAAYGTPDRLISDLNGERWRAEEFGFAASAAGPAVANLVAGAEAPALYLGDCGTAMGPVMTALALGDPPRRAHVSAGPVAMVSASSRLGPRAVMLVERSRQGNA